MTTQGGIFVISLDFELYWGMRDRVSLDSYGANLLGVRAVVPALLDLFAEYGIHATWATVGFLFFTGREDLLLGLPEKQPRYANRRLSPYRDLERLGTDERQDPFHFAPALIALIAASPGQEIGTHTFSHYYCLEPGQDVDAFRDDLAAAIRVARRYDLRLRSLVFPRNQFNARYLAVCAEMGITAYRGNESSWIYRARNEEEESLSRRAVRLVDAYVNLSSHNAYSLRERVGEAPRDIPSSRFLRPYSPRLRLLEPLRARRIRDDLTHAARTGQVYHLWWHPHNFGVNLEENLTFLRQILAHYRRLRTAYGMESLNMGELAAREGRVGR